MNNFFCWEDAPSIEIEWGATLRPMADENAVGSAALMNCGVMSFHQYGGHGRHIHKPDRAHKLEMMYCLSGEGIHIFWDENDHPTPYYIRPGDLICCVRDMPHCTTNHSEQPFECLIINAG